MRMVLRVPRLFVALVQASKTKDASSPIPLLSLQVFLPIPRGSSERPKHILRTPSSDRPYSISRLQAFEGHLRLVTSHHHRPNSQRVQTR